LRYAFTYKTINSKIKISGTDKIKVKPPEVHFSIRRQYPKVGHKNNFI
jgi:hypothetical protein